MTTDSKVETGEKTTIVGKTAQAHQQPKKPDLLGAYNIVDVKSEDVAKVDQFVRQHNNGQLKNAELRQAMRQVVNGWNYKLSYENSDKTGYTVVVYMAGGSEEKQIKAWDKHEKYVADEM